ncbi:MAG TPA: transaldolase [Candidatus Eisenbacteria bacterium]|nr:transaldolase [Candidatus Eisenbacteria bacterium]
MPSRAHQLLELGQSVWLDYIHRAQLASGEFTSLVRDSGVVGVTSNPTIFQQAIAEGKVYQGAIDAGVARHLEGEALFESLALDDIRTACDLLAPVFARTGGRDGRVSLEVAPRAAFDTHTTIADGRRLHREAGRPNVMIKVPATEAGLPAIAELTAEGVCVNITLIFSLDRYAQVIDAWLAGLERRVASRLDISEIFSVASFFVSRVDTKVDGAIEQRLKALPDGPERRELEGLRGQAAVANARLAYQKFRDAFGSARFAALRERGAHVQRPLWASTSTKNPAYPDTLYVDELIGSDTVNTMPPKTLQAFNDHGTLAVTIDRDLDQARRLFQRLPELGIPVNELIAQLEGEGVKTFAKSFDSLLETLEQSRQAAAGRMR